MTGDYPEVDVVAREHGYDDRMSSPCKDNFYEGPSNTVEGSGFFDVRGKPPGVTVSSFIGFVRTLSVSNRTRYREVLSPFPPWAALTKAPHIKRSILSARSGAHPGPSYANPSGTGIMTPPDAYWFTTNVPSHRHLVMKPTGQRYCAELYT